MEFTTGQIISASSAVSKLASQDMPMKLAMKFLRNGKALGEVHEEFDRRRRGLFAQFGNGTIVPSDKMDIFEHKVRELLNGPVHMELEMFELDELSELTLSPIDLSALEIMIME